MSNQNTANDLFIIATRKKFRFDSTKGGLTSEDLFDLNLTALDTIAVSLDEKIQKLGRKSFVQKKVASTSDLETQLEIVKYVIETKQAEDEARKTREKNAAQRQFLTGLKEKKQMAALESLSLEDIDKQLASLE
jgi:hypothetical protein